MKKHFFFLSLAFFVLLGLFSYDAQARKYETVPNDPLKTRIYTLDNGLKIYTTVNKDVPRIQTYVAVRVGGKNDPKETTGLAHYFEHLMFKGTKQFGTKDYAAEKPLLDKIEQLFEQYRNTTDEEQRKAIYKQIDEVSQEASKIAIPNEYDKLMAAIGSEGTNAFTSFDVTAYIETIPSNELENWALIQSDRFENPIIRLFHTELETVYEEKNMSLTNDSRKAYETTLSLLFPHHPYGNQTVLGSQEHLKNPSIINIKNYHATYYVPNNMAVILAGDFDPDQAVAVVEKYFGKMKPGNIPALNVQPEQAITQPIEKEVWGNDAENITIAFRMPGANNIKESAIASIVSSLMNNGKAGLIDLNINQKQKTLGSGGGYSAMADCGYFSLSGRPKDGQSLEQVKGLLLEQVDLLKKGEFPDWLIEATINNYKLSQLYQNQSNGIRARMLLNSFVNQTSWEDEVNKLAYQEKLTKKDIVDFANKYFGNNYVVVYKKKGKDQNELKMDKPQITPIATNRNDESEFLRKIKLSKVTPIKPVYVDYNKDMKKLSAKNNIPVLYKQNVEDATFQLDYLFEMGNNNDKVLGTAFSYLNFLGTSKYSLEEIKSEFYKLACSYSVFSSDDKVYVRLSGLADNFDKALALFEELLADPKADQQALTSMVQNMQKQRANSKLSQATIFSRLTNYATWGPKSAATNVLSAEELNQLKPEDLVQRIKQLSEYDHKVLYYGPKTDSEFLKSINNLHKTAAKLKPVPAPVKFAQQPTNVNKVLFAQYDARQIRFSMLTKGIEKFDKNLVPTLRLYNEYFGGGMNAIVFQEMREARGLAYSATARYSSPSKPELAYYFSATIATQNDKMNDAIKAFEEIINQMPESEKAFNLAKEGLISSLRTSRTLRSSVLWQYLNDQEFGYKQDSRIGLIEKIEKLTFADIKAFQEKNVKNKPYTFCILGDEKDLDFSYLKEKGEVQKLTLEELFGY